MWARALLRVARRGSAKGLLLASALGWMAMGWLLHGHGVPHAHAVSGPGFIPVWLTMILAMAPLLLLREVGLLWRTSLRRLRYLTTASFLAGYTGIWLLAGIAVSIVQGWLAAGSVRITFAVALALVWHCSPTRQRCLNACHRVPTLRVFGTAANWDSLRYGVATGCYCASACGVLMLLALTVKDYHLALMGLAAAVATFDRYLPARRPGWHLPFGRREQPVPDPYGFVTAEA